MKKKKIKINKNPIDYAEKYKDDYQRYLEKGDYNKKTMTKLLSRKKDNRKKELLSQGDECKKDGYMIVFQYSTGTYRAYIDVDLMLSSKNWWLFDDIVYIFGLKKRTSDNVTQLVKDYDDYKILKLVDFFVKKKTAKDRKLFKDKVVLNKEDILRDVKDIVSRVGRFVKLVKKLERI